MNFIQQEELEQLLRVRDMGIARVDIATQTRIKQLNAKTDEEYDGIQIPRLFPFNYQSIFLDYVDKKDEINDDNFLLDMYCRGYTININGYVVSKYGNLGAVAVSDLYRGEIKDYGSTCKSSLGRNIKSDSIEDKIIDFFIGQMRILCFFEFLKLFKQFTNFQIGTPMAHVIAQHYGLNTQFLDLTDDVKVALFFACCMHIGNNKYRPINSNDISEIGEYAVLYHGLEDECSQIIGYQPFTRCYKQRGYYIDTAASVPCWSFSLTNTDNYTKSYFKRTPEFSKRIFEEFDGGKALFPKDSLYYFEKEIEHIKESLEFPEIIFEQAFDIVIGYLNNYVLTGMLDSELLLIITKDWVREKIKDREMSISDRMLIKSSNEDIIENLNQAWNPAQYKKNEGIIAWGRECIRKNNGDFYLSKGRNGISLID